MLKAVRSSGGRRIRPSATTRPKTATAIANAGPNSITVAKWTVNESDMPLSWLMRTYQRSESAARARNTTRSKPAEVGGIGRERTKITAAATQRSADEGDDLARGIAHRPVMVRSSGTTWRDAGGTAPCEAGRERLSSGPFIPLPLSATQPSGGSCQPAAPCHYRTIGASPLRVARAMDRDGVCRPRARHRQALRRDVAGSTARRSSSPPQGRYPDRRRS